jgi:hypothetical protein
VALWIVWIGSLDLDKAFTAYGLVAASGVIQIRRVREEADRALGCIFIQEDL